MNGSTRADYTNYYEQLPSNALELGLYLEADRMRGLRLTDENVQNQIAVVKEEIRVNVVNQPFGGFPWILLPPVMFRTFANAHNGYGSFVDLEAATVDQAADFFDQYYAPGNATLVVAGDLDVDPTREMVERHFGPDPGPGRPTPRVVRRAGARRGAPERSPRPAGPAGARWPSPTGFPTRSTSGRTTWPRPSSPTCWPMGPPPACISGW